MAKKSKTTIKNLPDAETFNEITKPNGKVQTGEAMTKDQDLDRQLWKIEKIADELNSYAIHSAIKAADLGNLGGGVAVIANRLKESSVIIKNIVEGYKYKSDVQVRIMVVETGDTNLQKGESAIDVEGKYVESILQNIKIMAQSVENDALDGLLEGIKLNARAFLICVEAVRRSALDLLKIVKGELPNIHRRYDYLKDVITDPLPITTRSLDYLFFVLGGNLILEDFGYIVQIMSYKVLNKIEKHFSDEDKKGKPLTMQSSIARFQIDRYIDLYSALNQPKPADENLMKIIVLSIPTVGFQTDGEYSRQFVAIPVDCINYAMSTKIGATVTPVDYPFDKKYLRDCWSNRDVNYIAENDVNFNMRNSKVYYYFINWLEMVK